MSIDQQSLRERTRAAIRSQVQQEAWTLFAEHGYEATTVDVIAAAAGMSRRTFFRYFQGKEDLIVSRMIESAEETIDALRARPAEESSWPALRAAFQVILDRQLADPERARRLHVMLSDEPAVRSTIEEWRRRWTSLLRPVVAERMPGRQSDGPDRPDRRELRAEAIVRSALECLEVAQEAWAREPGADVNELLDETMGAVQALR